MKTVLEFIGMTSASLVESCQGDRIQGQQSVAKANSTLNVHSVLHDISAATKKGEKKPVVYYSARLRMSDRERTRGPHRRAQILQ